MPGSCFRLLCAFTFAICLGLAMGNARAADPDPDGRLFQPAVDPLADVQQALSRAAGQATATGEYWSSWARTGVTIHALWRRGCTARRWPK